MPRVMPVRIAPDPATGGEDAVHTRREEKSLGSRVMGTGDQKRKCLLLNEKVRHDGEFGALFCGTIGGVWGEMSLWNCSVA